MDPVVATVTVLCMSSANLTRQSLLLKLRDQGDDAAWEEFTGIYRPYLYRVTEGLGVAAHEREDVIQDVMLMAWKQLPGFDYDRQRGKFRGWLCTVTRRRVIALRKTKSRREGDGYAPLSGLETLAIEPEVEALSEREWQRHVSEMAWERISERFEDNVLAAFRALAEGRKGEDVAAELGLSPNSVYVYKKRVLAALHKEIAYLD